MAENKPILELSTLIEKRQQIAIDGELYNLLSFGDMGVREQARFVIMGREIQAVRDVDEITDESADKLDALARQFVNMVVDAPGAILNKLAFHHCSAIIQVFITAAGIEIPPLKPREESLPTGAKSSQPSSDSMAEVPTNG